MSNCKTQKVTFDTPEKEDKSSRQSFSEWQDQPSQASVYDIDQQIYSHLNSKEKEELAVLIKKLNQLEMPQKPPGAFTLYIQDKKSKGSMFIPKRSTNHKEIYILKKKQWDAEPKEVRAQYEEQAELKYVEYQRKGQEIAEKGEELWEQVHDICNRGDLNQHAKKKKISAYRVFKRETAQMFKTEYPAMKNSERQMIVKEKWKCLADNEKLVFVILAKLQEEKEYHDQIQEFYKQRIQAAKLLVNTQVQFQNAKQLSAFNSLIVKDAIANKVFSDSTKGESGSVGPVSSNSNSHSWQDSPAKSSQEKVCEEDPLNTGFDNGDKFEESMQRQMQENVMNMLDAIGVLE